MGKMKKFMAVHNDPKIDFNEIQSNWRKLARVESSTWDRTYYNEEKSVRYCLWLASSEEDLKNIFTEMGISWESILEVEEIVPDLWGENWKMHLEKEQVADTLGV